MDSQPTIPLTPKEIRFWKKVGLIDLLAPGPIRNKRNLVAIECPTCGKHVFGSVAYKGHLKMHSEDKPLTCSICDYRCARGSHLKNHMNTHRPMVLKEVPVEPSKLTVIEERILKKKGLISYLMPGPCRTKDNRLAFICPKCDKMIPGTAPFNIHWKAHHSEKPEKEWKCDLCEYRTTTKKSLDRHSLIHSDEKSHACDICGKRFKDKLNLPRHMRIHTKSTSKKRCLDCGEEFSDEYTFSQHVNSVHPGYKAYECKHCGKRFQTPLLQKEHENTHEATKHYSCQFCDKKFHQLTVLKQHVKLHDRKESHTCYFCKEVFTDVFHFRRHCKEHTEYYHKDTKKFECAQCDKQLKGTYSILVDHMRARHSDEKDFKCEICTMGFKSERALESHQKVHRNKKEHQCYFCKEIFPDYASFNVHRQQHTELYDEEKKKYICLHCGGELLSYKALVNHIRGTHTGEKPFKCDSCRRKFFSMELLKSHMKHRHHIVKLKRKNLYNCLVCKANCIQESDVSAHVKKHKNSKPDESSDTECTTDEDETQNVTDNQWELEQEEDITDAMPFENVESTEGEWTDDEVENPLEDAEEEVSMLTVSSLPLSVEVYRESMKNNESCFIIWIKNLEFDLIAIASQICSKYYFCFLENHPEKFKTLKSVKGNDKFTQVKVAVSTEDNVITNITIVSLAGANMIKKKHQSMMELENYLMKISNCKRVVHYVRNNQREEWNRLTQKIKSRAVICNYVEHQLSNSGDLSETKVSTVEYAA